MTPKQLRTTLARIGLSQRGAARLLDIDERTMRKYIAGDLVIPELLVWALRGLALRERDQDTIFGGVMHAANPAPAPPRLRAGALVHPSRGQERQVLLLRNDDLKSNIQVL